MANISIIINEREADIGGFKVGRLLPSRMKRSVGPFVFLDHMGPAELKAGENMDVLAHPHIGLSTLTYLFEGTVLHRDSIGSETEIRPGAVNWMTAVKGIVHSERSPEYVRNTSKRLHGFQIWVAMPVEMEEAEPSFHHIPADMIPTWEYRGAQFRLIAGELFDKISPVPVHSRFYFLEFKSKEQQIVNFDGELYGESAIYILDGKIKIGEIEYNSGQLLVLENDHTCEFVIEENSVLYIIGGEPFPEKRFINWNFVSSSREKIDQAIERWEKQEFPDIPGEEGFVPYPAR